MTLFPLWGKGGDTGRFHIIFAYWFQEEEGRKGGREENELVFASTEAARYLKKKEERKNWRKFIQSTFFSFKGKEKKEERGK